MSVLYVKTYCISVIVFCVDRLTKCFAYYLLSTNDFSCGEHVSFSLTYNTGIAWSLLADAGSFVEALIVVITFYLLYELFLYVKERAYEDKSIIGECLVIAGGLSNVCDRCLYPGVVDFIKISLGDYTFPIFNIADVSVCVGIIIMLIAYWYHKK